jgi:hypothetical protein
MSDVIMFIRRTRHFTTWEDINVMEDRKQWWNKLFRVPYYEFRVELSKIAATNYDKLRADKIYYTIEDFVEAQPTAVKPGDWILPLDDDDWLCDGICQRIKEVMSPKDFLVWPCNVVSVFKYAPPNYLTLKSIRPAILKKISTVGMVNSCCYAMRNELATYDNLINHTSASQLQAEREYVDDPGLEACYLNLPTSQSALCRMITSMDDLKTSVETVQLLDEAPLAHRPEFVTNLRRVKKLFAAL